MNYKKPHPPLLTTFSWMLLLLWMMAPRGFSGEMIRQVQEELRKRNLFFGEIDGKSSEGVQKAVAKYQTIKGFAVSGQPDADTLRSLGLDTAEAVELPVAALPDVAVLKSDAPRELTEADRKLVDEMKVGELTSPGEGPGLQVEAPTPGVIKGGSASPGAPPGKLAAAKAEVEVFLHHYLEACEENDLDAEMAHYAAAVDYFDHGLRKEAFIRKDVQSYYRRWPTRRYELENLEVADSAPAERVVKFRISFKVANGKSTAAGETDNIFKMRQEGEQWKFTSMKEQRLRR